MYRAYDFFRDSSPPSEYRNVGLIDDAARLASELEYTLYALDPSGNNLNEVDASHARPAAVHRRRQHSVLARGRSQGQPDPGGGADRRRGDVHRRRRGRARRRREAHLQLLLARFPARPRRRRQGARAPGGGCRATRTTSSPTARATWTARRAARGRPHAGRAADRRDREPARGRAGARQAHEQVPLVAPRGCTSTASTRSCAFPTPTSRCCRAGRVAWGQVRVVVMATDPRATSPSSLIRRCPIEISGRQARRGEAAGLLRVPFHPRDRGRHSDSCGSAWTTCLRTRPRRSSRTSSCELSGCRCAGARAPSLLDSESWRMA